MKKVLIIRSKSNKLDDITKGLEAGFEGKGAKVDIKKVGNQTRIINFAIYDIVLVGSPVLGLLGGKIDDGIEGFLKQCKRTVGKDVVAFVNSKLIGSAKAVKVLMSKLEKMGCIVKDFRQFADKESAEKYIDGLKL